MKKLFLLSLFISSGAFAQTIVLENTQDLYMKVALKYVVNADTGAAGIQATYAETNTDELPYSYNFTVNGLSYRSATEELVFNDGSQDVVCAKMGEKRMIFKYKTLVETGNCELLSESYQKEVTTSDGIKERSDKLTYRKLSLAVHGTSNLSTSNASVIKWSTND